MSHIKGAGCPAELLFRVQMPATIPSRLKKGVVAPDRETTHTGETIV